MKLYQWHNNHVLVSQMLMLKCVMLFSAAVAGVDTYKLACCCCCQLLLL